MATELEYAGLRLQGDPLWSARALIEHPELVATVHLTYARAGADILTTASYQATIPGLIREGFSAAAAQAVLQRSVTLAMQARDRHAHETPGSSPFPLLVASGSGPYGAHLADGSEYTGNYTSDPVRLSDFHRRHIDILAATEADILACESIPSLHEGEVLATILAEIPEKAAWVSFTCPDHRHVSYGDLLRDCIDLFRDTPHVLAGVNCITPHQVAGLMTSTQDRPRGLEVVYANRGEIWDPDTGCWQVTTSLNDADHVRLAQGWVRQGVRIVGGCCHTTPAFIQALCAMRSRLVSPAVPESPPHSGDTSGVPDLYVPSQ